MTRTHRRALGMAVAASLAVIAAGWASAPDLLLVVAGVMAAAAIAVVSWTSGRQPLRPLLPVLPETYDQVVITAPRAGHPAAHDAA